MPSAEREREVLALVAEGLSTKQVARALRTSEATVKAHLGHVFSRTGTASRTAAAVGAREHLPGGAGTAG